MMALLTALHEPKLAPNWRASGSNACPLPRMTQLRHQANHLPRRVYRWTPRNLITWLAASSCR